MKNRILWIFEDGEQPNNIDDNQQTAEETVAEINSLENSSFVALPWVMFGALTQPERDKINELYRTAYERALASQDERSEEMDRFERLLDGVNALPLSEEY